MAGYLNVFWRKTLDTVRNPEDFDGRFDAAAGASVNLPRRQREASETANSWRCATNMGYPHPVEVVEALRLSRGAQHDPRRHGGEAVEI